MCCQKGWKRRGKMHLRKYNLSRGYLYRLRALAVTVNTWYMASGCLNRERTRIILTCDFMRPLSINQSCFNFMILWGARSNLSIITLLAQLSYRSSFSLFCQPSSQTSAEGKLQHLSLCWLHYTGEGFTLVPQRGAGRWVTCSLTGGRDLAGVYKKKIIMKSKWQK